MNCFNGFSSYKGIRGLCSFLVAVAISLIRFDIDAGLQIGHAAAQAALQPDVRTVARAQ